MRLGVAGWGLPAEIREEFPPGESLLARYAQRFNAVEINTSFDRPHQRSTYRRWAEATPASFEFAVKAPRSITHERRLKDAEPLIDRFCSEIAGLGDKLGPVLIQLPPSLNYDGDTAHTFLETWRRRFKGATALEPRHPSWFCDAPNTLLTDFSVARVAADPPPVPEAVKPGGSFAFAYRRLHGSPDVYASSYEASELRRWAAICAACDWLIFDNTKFGAATQNALQILRREATGPEAGGDEDR